MLANGYFKLGPVLYDSLPTCSKCFFSLPRLQYAIGHQPTIFSCGIRKYSSDENEHPARRTLRILKSEMKEIVKIVDGIQTEEDLLPKRLLPRQCDILIIGGGVIGSSIAYWLKQRALNGLSIVVLEKDPSVMSFNNKTNFEYSEASTTLSCGGLRHQFSLPENIQMSMFGAEFLRNINDHLGIEGQEPPDVQFTPQGYLFLATEKSAKILEENAKLQRSFGAKNELLTSKQLKSKYPWMNTDGIELGCHGLENEGWFDPWSLLTAFRNKASYLGVEYVTGELTGFKFEKTQNIIMDKVPFGEYEAMNEARVRLPDGTETLIEFSQLVIAAGCHSGAVGELARIGTGNGFNALPIPVEPRKRYVYCVHCPDGPGFNAPFVIDPSGMYVRREGLGGNYICGRSPDPSDEPSCDNLENVDYKFFEENVWPVLAHRIPAFESLKIKSGWAGYYDFNTFDENAFIGPHPGFMNVWLATGFSGHGLQQAPAVGRAIMELIVDGRFVTIDLSRMQYERIFHDDYLLETNIV